MTDESGSVVEQFDYLPYGEMCQNSTYPVAVHEKTDYLYTGKELQQFFGIDWYDSFARFQTTSGVFTSPDPLAEKYYSLSPYAYCARDPVNRIDPNGNIWETAIEVASLVTGVKSFTANVKDGNVGGAIVDGIGIVLDVAAVVTPFAPGVAGAGISAIRAVDKGADALKVVDKVSDAAKAADRAGDVAQTAKSVKTYQTYTRTNKVTGEIYVGRTSGTGTPEQNVKRRDQNHHMNKQGYGPAELDKTSTNPDAIRGQEQFGIAKNGGAKVNGGTSGNIINRISRNNPKRQQYENARRKEFGN